MNRRRVTLFTLLLLLAAVFTALAAGASVTLRADDPVHVQAAAFEGYLAGLPQAERAEWHQALEEVLAQQRGAAILSLFDEPQGSEGAVYIVSSGKVYHGTRGCTTLSRSKNIREVSMEEALSMGRRACKVCR